jgi:molybdenum cofactor cytidylyltransferase
MSQVAPRQTDAVAAIVLAAGRSSRMGDFKPLLPFGGQTLIAHMTGILREAGVARIHVVTGFNAAALRSELARLGVTTAHNADFNKGMLSSVQTGVASLPEKTEALLLAPVDLPLLRASTIARLLRASTSADKLILYPTFRGERGHPPLIRRSLFAEILGFAGNGGLQALLAEHEDAAADVSVFDRGCLSDMDCPEDYRRLSSALARHRFPDDEECEAMLEAAATESAVRRHCRAVAALAASLSWRLRLAGEPLDPDLTRAAASLHDIAKGLPHHAETGAAIVTGFGFPELREAVSRHMDIGVGAARIDESAVVYLADKLVRGESRVPLESRFASARVRFAANPSGLAAVERRLASARAILRAIESRVGRLDPAREANQEELTGTA